MLSLEGNLVLTIQIVVHEKGYDFFRRTIFHNRKCRFEFSVFLDWQHCSLQMRGANEVGLENFTECNIDKSLG